ncbi:MAG: glycoside hydrolase family 97 C-terminal domain-containing protein [Bacteroidota bacterium]|nr:glycoside hydrolase family 97 C-terminal domain-containing protein [Bacteroidota bacterium]
MPTVWDDTKVLEGKIGEYATIARKTGRNWFIGSLTDQSRLVTIPLEFLNKEKKYIATVYRDDPHSGSSTHVSITRQTLTSDTILQFQLEAKNGVAVILEEK